MQLEARSPATGERLGAVEGPAVTRYAPRPHAPPPPSRCRRPRRRPRGLATSPGRAPGAGRARRPRAAARRDRAAADRGDPRRAVPTIAGLGDLADDGRAPHGPPAGRPAPLRGGRAAVGVQQPRSVSGCSARPPRPGRSRRWRSPARARRQRRRVRPGLALTGEPLGARSCAPGSRRSCWPSSTATRPAKRCPTRVRAWCRSPGRSEGGDACSRARRSSRSPPLRCGRRSPPGPPSRRCRRHLCVPRSPAVARRARQRAARLPVGDPASEETEVGPLRSAEDLDVEALVEEAVAGGAELVPGGPSGSAGFRAPSTRPWCARSRPRPGSCTSRCPDRCSPSSRRPARPPRSGSWATGRRITPRRPPRPRRRRERLGPRPREGERVARTLGTELTWVDEHGAVAPGPALRLERHVAPRLAPGPPSSAARAACPTTRRSFGPEPRRPASPTAARWTGWPSCAATPALRRGPRWGFGHAVAPLKRVPAPLTSLPSRIDVQNRQGTAARGPGCATSPRTIRPPVAR